MPVAMAMPAAVAMPVTMAMPVAMPVAVAMPVIKPMAMPAMPVTMPIVVVVARGSSGRDQRGDAKQSCGGEGDDGVARHESVLVFGFVLEVLWA